MKFNTDNKLVDYKRISGVILYDKAKLIKMKKKNGIYLRIFFYLTSSLRFRYIIFIMSFFLSAGKKMLMSYKNVPECLIFFFIY